MKRFAAVLCLVTLACLAVGAGGRPEYDLIIRNGRVLDGAGNPWVYTEIAIRGDRIVRMARHISGSARRVVDAKDQIVSPGFIDMHTHSDLTLLTDGNAESKIRQGVTTEILGEASSVAPVCKAVLAESGASAMGGGSGPRRDWTDFDGYYRKLLRRGTSVNVASYIGLSTVRLCAMGPDMRDPTPVELGKEIQIVGQAMRQGAIGLSSGLIYPPGSYAKTDEIVALAKVAAQYGGIYTSHIRNEGNGLLNAIDETLTIANQAHIPVHILHIKATGSHSTENAAAAISKIEDARARGLEVTADQYPYIASSTGLSTHVPEWVQDGGTAEMVKRLRDPETRAKIREIVVRANSDPEKMVIASLHKKENKRLEGLSIGEAAKLRNEDPNDTVLNLLSEENGRVGMVFFTMKEDDVRNFMQRPWVSFGSDGSSVRPTGPLSEGKPHPRFYGSNVRVLGRYVREDHVLTLEDAVRKMTSLAAQQVGIHNRGLLAEGMKADIVVFDPDRVIDKATFKEPHQFADGVNYVVVNGQVVIDAGKHTGKRPGQAIYGPGRAMPDSRKKAK